MSAAQERDARAKADVALVALPPSTAGRCRATEVAKAIPALYGKSVGRSRMVDFILETELEPKGLAENRGGWWRRTTKGDKHVRNLR